eukprot:scpid109585/ scgid26261/ 
MYMHLILIQSNSKSTLLLAICTAGPRFRICLCCMPPGLPVLPGHVHRSAFTAMPGHAPSLADLPYHSPYTVYTVNNTTHRTPTQSRWISTKDECHSYSLFQWY